MMNSKQMAKFLQTKLTKDEYSNLLFLIDSMPPGGSFWRAIADCENMSSEMFANDKSVMKTEHQLVRTEAELSMIDNAIACTRYYLNPYKTACGTTWSSYLKYLDSRLETESFFINQ